MGGFRFEYEAHNMVPYKGLKRALHALSYGDWRASDGSLLTGATVPTATVQDNIGLIDWAWNRSGASPIYTQVVIPDDFDVQAQMLVVGGWVRKKLNAADENPTLNLQATARTWTPNDAASVTLATAATVLLPGPVAGADLTGWTQFSLDLGARFVAEGKKLVSGQAIRVYLFPSAQVGTAAMSMQIANMGIFTRRHMVPRLDANR